jgi:hypothetical protein
VFLLQDGPSIKIQSKSGTRPLVKGKIDHGGETWGGREIWAGIGVLRVAQDDTSIKIQSKIQSKSGTGPSELTAAHEMDDFKLVAIFQCRGQPI